MYLNDIEHFATVFGSAWGAVNQVCGMREVSQSTLEVRRQGLTEQWAMQGGASEGGKRVGSARLQAAVVHRARAAAAPHAGKCTHSDTSTVFDFLADMHLPVNLCRYAPMPAVYSPSSTSPAPSRAWCGSRQAAS